METYIIIIFATPFLLLLYHAFIYQRTKIPIIMTPQRYYTELFDNFPIKKDSVVYELGCGRGDFLFGAEKFEPKKMIGMDLSFAHVWHGKIKAILKKSKVKIIYQDYFKADISDADVIYIFSVKPIVIKTWEKVKKETRPGTIMIVLSDTIPGTDYFRKIRTQPEKQKSTYYYLYQV